MLKEQKWVLKKIQSGSISAGDILHQLHERFNRSCILKTEKEIDDVIKFLATEGYIREDKVKDISLLGVDIWYLVLSPFWLTEKGHKYGKWNWEKIANWSLTILGLGLAASTFYFQFFVNNTDKI